MTDRRRPEGRLPIHDAGHITTRHRAAIAAIDAELHVTHGDVRRAGLHGDLEGLATLERQVHQLGTAKARHVRAMWAPEAVR